MRRLLPFVALWAACASPPGQAQLGLPAQLSQELVLGAPDPAPATVALTNTGSCDLDFTASAYTQDGLPWLSVSPGSGTLASGATASLSAAFSSAGLAPGTHVGTLVVSGTCASTGVRAVHSPATVEVALTIVEGDLRVGGQVSGLSGAGLVLARNGGRHLSISADGPYSFPIGPGASYAISVARQPEAPDQVCAVANATGTVGTADVSGVDVSCRTVRRLGGTVTGLVGTGLVLSAGGPPLAIAADGPFAFAGPFFEGDPYSVSVTAQPQSPAQQCSVADGTGTFGAADVEVTVTCRNSHRLRPRVVGLLGTGLVLSDGYQDLAVAAPGLQTFDHPYFAGDGYTVTIVSQPTSPAQTCTLQRAAGLFAEGDVTSVVVSCPLPAGPLYGASLLWNSYVKNDGPSMLESSGTACNGTEAGPINACVHAGEMVALEVRGLSSCAGLTAADALGAFQWRCLASSPYVKMVSTGLQPEKGLADLVDFATRTWKANSVQVSEGGEPLLSSTSAAWHQNPVLLPAQTGTVTLSTAGAVYLVPASTTVNYVVGAPRVALAIAPGAALTRGGSAFGAVYAPAANGVRFFWAEGQVNAATGYGLHLAGTRQSVLRNVKVRSGQVRLVDSSANRLHGVSAANTGDCLWVDATSAQNLMERLTVSDCGTSGVRVQGSNNTFADVLVASSRIGIYVNGATTAASNAVLAHTSALEASYAFWAGGAPETTLVGFASADTNAGVYFSGTTTGRVFDLASSHFVKSDAPLAYNPGLNEAATSAVTWAGVVKVGTASPLCQKGATAVACDTFVETGTALQTDASLLDSFVGKVSSDLQNTSDTDGLATFATTLDWSSFDNPLRAWGREGTWPSAAVQDPCEAGAPSCRIWDWSLKASDTVALGALPLPAGAAAVTLAHAWTVADEAACGLVPGAAWTAPSACRTSFLARALELTGDGVGNDNLFCEAGERCLYTPNLGAYQGHGELAFAGMGGVAGDVELYRYAANGR